jgi:hypothetical protein
MRSLSQEEACMHAHTLNLSVEFHDARETWDPISAFRLVSVTIEHDRLEDGRETCCLLGTVFSSLA